jgi:hypothetical protein
MAAVLAGILTVFAVLHIVGGTSMVGRADQSSARAETLISGD